jgi:hypothetical protein
MVRSETSGPIWGCSPAVRAPRADECRGPASLSSNWTRGFSPIVEVFAPGMTAMSAPVRTRAGKVLGVVTIAGPMFRLPEERMLEIGSSLMATAAEIAEASGASSLFRVKAA